MMQFSAETETVETRVCVCVCVCVCVWCGVVWCGVVWCVCAYASACMCTCACVSACKGMHVCMRVYVVHVCMVHVCLSIWVCSHEGEECSTLKHKLLHTGMETIQQSGFLCQKT